MTKLQYFRLCIVLLLPLLLIGWWLSAKEILFPHHGVISCSALVDGFVCVSTFTEREKRNQMMSMNGAVTVEGKARLEFGFRQAVTVSGTPSSKSAEAETRLQGASKNGRQELLILPLPSMSKRASEKPFGDYSSCNFGPYPDKENAWGYMCIGDGGDAGVFSFADENVNRKFHLLVQDVRTKSDENARLSITAQIASFLAPFGIFLLLSFVIIVFIKTVKFVIGPRRSAS